MMPPKRSLEESRHEGSGRDRKKARIQAARTIQFQIPEGAPGASGSSKVATSSLTVNSMKGLPTAVDVEKFMEARAFEIQAMESAMASAKDNASQRAFQDVPRHLRRRAASHDVRRLPVRLREKARAEMDPPKKKTGRPKPKMGKSKRISRTESLRKRQLDKNWLETHIWHAKRMHMINKWGYRLAREPTEKSFRPSVRAAAHGSILHDASYIATIEITAKEKLIKEMLAPICDPQGAGPSAVRYTSGGRICETVAYQPNKYPFGMIGPMVVIWKPLLPTSLAEAAKPEKNPPPPKEKGKTPPPRPPSGPVRAVWLRIHPAAFEDLSIAIQESAGLILNAYRENLEEGEEDEEIEIADLRGDLCAFEVTGPKSTQVIRGALNLLNNEERKEFKDVWRELHNLQNPASVPRGMIFGMTVYDPRLHFPPKNAKPEKNNGVQSTPGAFTTFPSSVLARTDLWDEEIRINLSNPRYQKKDLDSRRAQNLVPGTPLRATAQDDRIPIMLIQRSVGMQSGLSVDGDFHGWTLLIPKGWGMAFFSSLIFTGTRIGGLRERHVQYFEAGSPSFPQDWVCSAAYAEHATEKGEEEKARWERMPPAKRTNWDTVRTRSPWIPDWSVVLGLKVPESEETLPTERDDAIPTTDVEPWLLRGPDVSSIIQTVLSAASFAEGLVSQLNTLRSKRGIGPCTLPPDVLLRNALVTTKVIPCNRGCPEDMAVIYSVDPTEAQQRRSVLQQSSSNSVEPDAALEESSLLAELSASIPEPSAIIGYVTTGNFSLRRGKGHAIGTIAVSKLIDIMRQEQGEMAIKFPLLVKVRNRHATICRPAVLEIV